VCADLTDKKRKVRFFRVLLVILVIIAVGFLGLSLYTKSIKNAFAMVQMVFGYGVDKVTGQEAFRGQNEVNILVFGVDVPFGSGVRTDTIKLVHINKREKSIAILSIPRDLWTVMPDDSHNRINVAHSLGKEDSYKAINYTVETVKKTLKEYTGRDIKIDYYVRIHTHRFVELIDAIGGIDLDVEKAMKYKDPSQDLFIDLQPGFQHLDGYNAMCYSRFRMDAEGDWGRMRRQDQVIRAIADKIQNDGKAINAKSVSEMLKLVLTNLKLQDLMALKRIATNSGGMDNIFSVALSAEPKKIGGADVLVVEDYEKAKQEILDVVVRPRKRILVVLPPRYYEKSVELNEKYSDTAIFNLGYYTVPKGKDILLDGAETPFDEVTTRIYARKDRESKGIADDLKSELGLNMTVNLRDKITYPGSTMLNADANNSYDVMVVLDADYFEGKDR